MQGHGEGGKQRQRDTTNADTMFQETKIQQLINLILLKRKIDQSSRRWEQKEACYWECHQISVIKQVDTEYKFVNFEKSDKKCWHVGITDYESGLGYMFRNLNGICVYSDVWWLA